MIVINSLTHSTSFGTSKNTNKKEKPHKCKEYVAGVLMPLTSQKSFWWAKYECKECSNM